MTRQNRGRLMSSKGLFYWLIVPVVSATLGFLVAMGCVAAGLFDGRPKPPPPGPPEWGAFSGTPKVELLDDGRKLKLTENFVYTDPAKRAWVAVKGSAVDGASIPRAFWAVTGGPLEGQYRN